MTKYTHPEFVSSTPPELNGGPAPDRYPVVIIGAGPIGLAAAIDLALHQVPVVVLDDNNKVSVGSRAICWAKRTLEIYDRLGIGERMIDKGVTWQTGRLFHGDNEVFNFDLQPDTGYKMPAFINLQQYYVEQYLVERAREFPTLIDLRFLNKVTEHTLHADGVTLDISSNYGDYQLQADYVLACDGAGSPTRKRMNLAFEGQTFEERFLIADIEMAQAPFHSDDIAERWFWFKPPFHEGQSALLHKQPDNIYRIDLQLGPDADPDYEKQPDVVIPRIRQIVGDNPFELDWVSVYRFTCARLERFVHGRLLFVGDSAHVVSPFGARGGNGGIQDVDNLAWKLAAVIHGTAPESLLETYNTERIHGSDENIRHSAQATRFMSPVSAMERQLRDEVLSLSKDHPFARSLINSGRLSTPCHLTELGHSAAICNDHSTTDAAADSTLPDSSLPGRVAPDAPLQDDTWLIASLGQQFTLLTVQSNDDRDTNNLMAAIAAHPLPPLIQPLHITNNPIVSERYGDGVFLIRPDQHIAARWSLESITPERITIERIKQALAHCLRQTEAAA